MTSSVRYNSLLLIFLAACSRSPVSVEGDNSSRNYVSRAVAEQLLEQVLAASKTIEPRTCRGESDFDRSGYIVPILQRSSTKDIEHVGKFPWGKEDPDAVEILLRTERWPELGISVLVKRRGATCLSYSLSSTRKVEQRDAT